MEPLLKKLKDCRPEKRGTRKKLPKRGVYVFYEDDKPLYVGRSNDMWQRIMTHGRNGAGHNQATFAFRLFQVKLDLPVGHDSPNDRPKTAEEHADEFRKQKERVRNMTIRAVKITEDVVQYLFEAYAILALDTKRYNKFHTT